MGLGEEVFLGEIPVSHCPLSGEGNLYVRCLWMLHKYGGALKTPAALMHLFEEPCRTHCGREKWMAVHWTGLRRGQVGWTLMPH